MRFVCRQFDYYFISFAMAATSTLPTGVGPFIFSAVWAVLAALVAATLFCSPISKPYRLPPVPVILSEIKDRQARKLRYFQSPRETLNAGYKKFGERIWGIDTSQGLKLVLPTTYLDELKSHPALSFTESISHDAMKPYTGVGGLSDDIVQLFKSKFNPTVGAYIPYLQDFFGRNISEVFQCEDHWVETTVYDKMLQLVSVVSTRAFYTEAASQDEEWLDLAQAYIATVLDYLHALKQWPQSLRPVACFWIPQRAMLMEQWRRLISHLLATLQTRLSSGSPADPPSIFDHIVDLRRDITTEELIHAQIALVVAGMHTTAAGLTQLVYDMAAHPEQARELRDEVLGASYDQWTKNSLGGLKKLDSWMKESQRMTSADLSEYVVMFVCGYELTIQLLSNDKQQSLSSSSQACLSPEAPSSRLLQRRFTSMTLYSAMRRRSTLCGTTTCVRANR